MTARFRGPLLVDGHVHFHDCYDRTAFLDGALDNFRAAAAALNLDAEPAGCLMFSECAGVNVFQTLYNEAGRPGPGPWRFHRTGEDASLIAQRGDGDSLLLLAGRQIITSEGLEVLALASSGQFSDGLDLPATLDAISRDGAIAVLPWGFGKWWFGRGKVMAKTLETLDPKKVYLGDNGGRPGALPAPGLFALGRGRGMLVLPGTDPFPLATANRKAGSYGFILRGEIEGGRPAGAIKDILARQTGQPPSFGGLESLIGFVRNQINIRMRKR